MEEPDRPSPAVTPPPFRPTPGEQLTPSGGKARAAANLAAIRLVRQLASDNRVATAVEQQILAAWSSWGVIPQIFDSDKADWDRQRAELKSLLDEGEWASASRTVINAHYTDPAIVAALWDAVTKLGLTTGQVLEPGSGSGTVIGLAPSGMTMTGVELDPITAAIASALYPGATIRAESFADTRYPSGTFDAAVGNVLSIR